MYILNPSKLYMQTWVYEEISHLRQKISIINRPSTTMQNLFNLGYNFTHPHFISYFYHHGYKRRHGDLKYMKWTALWVQIPSQEKENQLNLGNLVRNLLVKNNHFKCIYNNISNKSSTISQPWTHYYQCNSSIIHFKVISCHDSPSYYTAWTFNLERILS